MKLARWACSSVRMWRTALLLTVLLSGVAAGMATATPVAPLRADLIVANQAEAPAADDPRWREVELTHGEHAVAAWYRVRLDADPREPPCGGRSSCAC